MPSQAGVVGRKIAKETKLPDPENVAPVSKQHHRPQSARNEPADIIGRRIMKETQLQGTARPRSAPQSQPATSRMSRPAKEKKGKSTSAAPQASKREPLSAWSALLKLTDKPAPAPAAAHKDAKHRKPKAKPDAKSERGPKGRVQKLAQAPSLSPASGGGDWRDLLADVETVLKMPTVRKNNLETSAPNTSMQLDQELFLRQIDNAPSRQPGASTAKSAHTHESAEPVKNTTPTSRNHKMEGDNNIASYHCI